MSAGSASPGSSMARTRASWHSARGFTLVELVVALVLLGLGAALVIPLFAPPRPRSSPVAVIVHDAHRLAIRRSETLRLDVGSDGSWTVGPTRGADRELLATGRLTDLSGSGFTLIVSPLGTCGLDAVSSAAVELPLDPLTCTVGP